MKTPALTLAVLVTMTASPIIFAQTPTTPIAPQTAPKSNDQFRAFLCAQSWSWERPSEKPQTISFAPSGNVTNNTWVARYTIVDPHKITLRMKDKTARITFSDDYMSYKGLDFNGATPVSGKPNKQQ